MSKKGKNEEGPAETKTPEKAPEAQPTEVTAQEPAPQEATTPTVVEAAPEEVESGLVLRVTPEDVLDVKKPFDPLAPGAFVALKSLFKDRDDQRYLEKLDPVMPEELGEALAALRPELRQNFIDALDRMNPTKIGGHARRRTSLSSTLFDIRVYHGTGNDEMRPKFCAPGGLYSTDGRYLATGDKDLADLHKVPETFRCYLIGNYEVNTYWGPKVTDEEAASTTRAPVCKSIDRIKGETYGLCDACPERPWKDNKPNPDACRSELTLIVVPADFSGVYRLNCTGTNQKPAKAMVKKTVPWKQYWDKPFEIGTEATVGKKDEKQRWFLIKPTVLNIETSPEEKAFLRVIARKLDTEYYWPERRRIWLAAANPKEPENKVTDLSGLRAKAGVGGPASSAGQLPSGDASAKTEVREPQNPGRRGNL